MTNTNNPGGQTINMLNDARDVMLGVVERLNAQTLADVMAGKVPRNGQARGGRDAARGHRRGARETHDRGVVTHALLAERTRRK